MDLIPRGGTLVRGRGGVEWGVEMAGRGKRVGANGGGRVVAAKRGD